MNRYGVFVHDPDGDSGEGVIVGPYRDVLLAERKAEAIRKAARNHPAATYDDGVEAIVVLLVPGSTAARDIAEHVI